MEPLIFNATWPYQREGHIVKRSALCLVFGVALAASSAIASAGTTASSFGSITNAIASWLYCALGNQSYCITTDGASDPTIQNK